MPSRCCFSSAFTRSSLKSPGFMTVIRKDVASRDVDLPQNDKPPVVAFRRSNKLLDSIRRSAFIDLTSGRSAPSADSSQQVEPGPPSNSVAPALGGLRGRRDWLVGRFRATGIRSQCSPSDRCAAAPAPQCARRRGPSTVPIALPSRQLAARGDSAASRVTRRSRRGSTQPSARTR